MPGLGSPGGRHPLFPGAPAGLDPAALGLLSEDMLAQWRTLGLPGLGLPGAPLTPPNTSVGSTIEKAPISPGPQDQGSKTPTNGRAASPNGPEDSDARETPTLTNGGDGSKTHSEGDVGSPVSRAESKSPQKLEDNLSSPVLPLSTPSASQLTASMASHFPPLNNPMSLSLPLPLSVPPLMSTGRIPKSDPMEGKLQDMLRYNMEKFAGKLLLDYYTTTIIRASVIRRLIRKQTPTTTANAYKYILQLCNGSKVFVILL